MDGMENVLGHEDGLADDQIHVEDAYENTIGRRFPDDNELDRLSARDSDKSVAVLKSRSLPKERRNAPPVPPNAKYKPKDLPNTQNFERMMTSRSIGMFDSPSGSQRSKSDHTEVR